ADRLYHHSLSRKLVGSSSIPTRQPAGLVGRLIRGLFSSDVIPVCLPARASWLPSCASGRYEAHWVRRRRLRRRCCSDALNW
ncbi:hypothetical protein C0J52_08855, partial [Blattella germanica]